MAYYMDRKKQKKINRSNWEKKVRLKRDNVFGIKCKICDRIRAEDTRIFLHNKDGIPHTRTIKYIVAAIKKPEEWIMLCGKCHTGVHFCMNHFNMKWNDIETLLKTKRFK